MNKAKAKWVEIKFSDSVDDVHWVIYDYLWVKVEAEIYLSRDQGETFKKVSWLTFLFINIKQVLAAVLHRKWTKK